MADNVAVEQNLPDIFKDIWKKYEFLEKTEESTSSDKVQVGFQIIQSAFHVVVCCQKCFHCVYIHTACYL